MGMGKILGYLGKSGARIGSDAATGAKRAATGATRAATEVVTPRRKPLTPPQKKVDRPTRAQAVAENVKKEGVGKGRIEGGGAVLAVVAAGKGAYEVADSLLEEENKSKTAISFKRAFRRALTAEKEEFIWPVGSENARKFTTALLVPDKAVEAPPPKPKRKAVEAPPPKPKPQIEKIESDHKTAKIYSDFILEHPELHKQAADNRESARVDMKAGGLTRDQKKTIKERSKLAKKRARAKTKSKRKSYASDTPTIRGTTMTAAKGGMVSHTDYRKGGLFYKGKK